MRPQRERITTGHAGVRRALSLAWCCRSCWRWPICINRVRFLFKDQISIQQVAREGARAGRWARYGRRLTAPSRRGHDPDDVEPDINGPVAHLQWLNMVVIHDDGDADRRVRQDAPRGRRSWFLRTTCTRFVYGSLFASLIGKPGTTNMTLNAQMVMPA